MPLRPKMELREYGKLFLRRKWMIVFSFLFILLAASVYCVVTPELYKSETTILIIPQSVPQDYVRSTVSVKVEQQLATIKQQVMSRTTLMKVMEELRLFEKERKSLSPEDVVELMRKRVGIDVVSARSRDSGDAFTLSFQYENPKSAMFGASRLASFFIDENLKTREQQATGTSEFLESQLKETKARLEELEAKVKEYKMRFMGELPQQMDANLRMLTGMQDRLRSNEASARALEDRKIYLEAQLKLMEKSITATVNDKGQTVSGYGQDPSQTPENQLALKRAKLAELTSKYTPKHPTVVAARQEVSDLERRLAEIQRSAPVPASGKQQADALLASAYSPSGGIEELRRMKSQLNSSAMEIVSLKREKKAIETNVAAVEQKIERSPKREQEMISLIRDYENQKKSYDDLLRKKLEADVSQNLEKRQKGTQFQILDPANLPQESFKPDRKKAMLIALLLALAAGFGGTIFLESTDLTLHDVRNFKHLYKVQILGTIPVVQDREYRRERALRRAAVIGGLVTFSVALSVFLIVYNAKIRTILNF
jgi:polysaccharide chain length determinant protein (PEP-CTERM system associated)